MNKGTLHGKPANCTSGRRSWREQPSKCTRSSTATTWTSTRSSDCWAITSVLSWSSSVWCPMEGVIHFLFKYNKKFLFYSIFFWKLNFFNFCKLFLNKVDFKLMFLSVAKWSIAQKIPTQRIPNGASWLSLFVSSVHLTPKDFRIRTRIFTLFSAIYVLMPIF